MNRMAVIKRLITNKIQNQKGETIGETLVALLIAALAMTMLAGAIGAAVNIVTTSNTKVDEYFTKDKNLVLSSGEEGTATIVISGVGESFEEEKNVSDGYYYWTNDAFSRTPVIRYAKSDSVSGG